MNRCSPVEMRKNLELVQVLKFSGIDFVAVPVLSESQKNELFLLVSKRLTELEETKIEGK